MTPAAGGSSASGDPHLINEHGDGFDVRKTGSIRF
jgi:hypothetical protein